MKTIACAGEHYYVAVAAQQAINSWDYADQNSESAGGHLATLTSASEDNFVRSYAGPILGDYWIGLTDSEVEGDFRWVTGEEFAFANWYSGEPNNYDGLEHFVTGNYGGAWNDNELIVTRDQIGGYVIEFDSSGEFGDAGNPFRDSSDRFVGSNGNDSIFSFGGNDSIESKGGNDLVQGGAGDDLIDSGTGADQLIGGAGADTLCGGLGADTLGGGSGIDTLSYAGSLGGVAVDLATSDVSGGHAKDDIVSGFENALGSDYNDKLLGNALANGLSGGDGNDWIEGFRGADVLKGGQGIDTLSYQSSGAKVSVSLATGIASSGHAEGDVISGFENLVGSDHSDTLSGNSFANVLSGGDGDDIIEGGAGADTIKGGAGIDTLSYQGSKAGVTVDLVTQSVSGGHANGDVITNFENVQGSGLSDVLTGNAAANVLDGGNGMDSISGGGSADSIFGSLRRDILTGGAGADHFVYTAVLDSGPSFADQDAITDFRHAIDLIDLHVIDAIHGGLNDAFAFIGTDTFSAAGQIRAIQSGDDTILKLNIEGADKAEMVIVLQGVAATTITADDFFL